MVVKIHMKFHETKLKEMCARTRRMSWGGGTLFSHVGLYVWGIGLFLTHLNPFRIYTPYLTKSS